MRTQVYVHRYESPEASAVEVGTGNPDDRLVVACVPSCSTLADLAPRVLAWMYDETHEERGGLRDDDLFVVPHLALDLKTGVDVVGRQVPHVGGTIEQARQAVKLDVDEAGAAVRSTASIAMSWSSGGPRPPPPRYFVCDGPFAVLLLRRQASWPYLVAWMGTPEALRVVT